MEMVRMREGRGGESKGGDIISSITIYFFSFIYFCFFKGKLVDCNDSIRKLIKVLVENKFESGAHFDYYDDL